MGTTIAKVGSYATFGKLHFQTEEEQQLWNEYSWLLTNYIIDYNATILSTLLERKEKNGAAPAAVTCTRYCDPQGLARSGHLGDHAGT